MYESDPEIYVRQAHEWFNEDDARNERARIRIELHTLLSLHRITGDDKIPLNL